MEKLPQATILAGVWLVSFPARGAAERKIFPNFPN
jgi:hypothetical protein